MIEREKRWKFSGEIPKDSIVDIYTITQCYASFKPDLRIRKITRNDKEEYSHCTKYFLKDNTREEVEQSISKSRYERIFEAISKKPIIKERTVVNLSDNLVAEVDKYLDNGEIVVEVEFPNDSTMNEFIPPDWFGEEIKRTSFSIHVFAKLNNMRINKWTDEVEYR